MITKKNTNRLLVMAATSALITMAALANAQSGQGDKTANASATDGPPRIVATSPKIGETDVKSELTEITVTFDRDMQAGFSWTGGPPDFPNGSEGKKPQWRDKRTCVLPVKLESGVTTGSASIPPVTTASKALMAYRRNLRPFTSRPLVPANS